MLPKAKDHPVKLLDEVLTARHTLGHRHFTHILLLFDRIELLNGIRDRVTCIYVQGVCPQQLRTLVLLHDK